MYDGIGADGRTGGGKDGRTEGRKDGRKHVSHCEARKRRGNPAGHARNPLDYFGASPLAMTIPPRSTAALPYRRLAFPPQSRAYMIEIPGSDTSTRLTTRCFREIQ